MKTKLLFVIPSLRGGGAEKVIVTLLNNFNRNKYELHVAIINLSGEYANLLSSDVIVHNLNSKRARNAIFTLVKLVRRLKPKAIISTLGQLNIILLMVKKFLPKNTKLIVREATIVSEAIKSGDMTKKWIKLYKVFYPMADAIISQSEFMKQDLIEIFGINSNKIKKIYNPVEINKIITMAETELNPFISEKEFPKIVCFGRLEEVKGYERLIKKVPDFIAKYPNLKLYIFGNGSYKGRLLKLIDDLNLEKNITINEFESNPYKWLRNADLFMLSSHYEGLPNVLLEALACECPVLVWDHPGGTREIMELLDINERMIPDITIADHFFNPMNVQETVREHFDVNHIVFQYEQLIDSVIKK
ncbi:glycosyl transferase [Paenibacillus montaniterrae]|uniref:Glycosyl transferase n=1 Tax=Paenibacillus montaniterrae TaxID=429341 RepID=A0A919YQS5_9BACL|nr:glycosyltransferase [Paenibacillus montaniterrae]GIP16504.1 glycosyl transferase [Paenibacillus montaniterrae]